MCLLYGILCRQTQFFGSVSPPLLIWKHWTKHGPIWGDWDIKNIKNGAILTDPSNRPVKSMANMFCTVQEMIRHIFVIRKI